MQLFVEAMASSLACAVPRGAGLHSYRLAEAVSCGCVPVVLADDWVMPFEDACTGPRVLGKANLSQSQFQDWACSLVMGEGVWPAPHVVAIPARMEERHRLAAAASTWATLRGTAWAAGRVTPVNSTSVKVTVGPYYLRVDEQDWWALPQLVRWANTSGLLTRLRYRLDLAWKLLYASPIRAAMTVVRLRHTA